MGSLFSLFVVIVLILMAVAGIKVANMQFFFGVVLPYAAVIIFILGVIGKALKWGRSPVPFKIPTTCGQQKSLPWIRQNKLDNPSSALGVIGRMLLEVLLFRSLFGNTTVELKEGPKLAHGSTKWLWLGGLAFHWSFLVVLLRHTRLFMDPPPAFLQKIEVMDGFLQIGLPGLFISGVVLLAAATYLFLRRVFIPQVRYISLPADYFPLFLIIAIAVSGILMRYFIKVDVVSIKGLTLGLFSLNASVPEGIGVLFYVHLFLVSILLAYIPFSKLMHFGGVFLSPTRNLANDSRVKRHINPWNYPVKLHTYEEYEDEFRDKMKEAGLPLDKE
ncbi:nitrate reductase gamma subunit [bacterium BMS3Abin10]|nr:nitrate reductase gamma subunit [bacterium BMS3Abin10]GBE37645.1 nitrate reductase gamma subunit [bacterium BMS3Bbin08]HDH51304.1 menaquinol oxidoreductase [Nitrospirota bacterium]